MSNQIVQQLFREFSSFYGGFAGSNIVLPTAISGVKANGIQFLLMFDEQEFAHLNTDWFLRIALSVEDVKVYAYAEPFMMRAEADGDLFEAIQVWVADSCHFLAGAWRVCREDGHCISKFEPFGMREGDDPENHAPAALLTHANLPGDRTPYIDLWQKMRTNARFADRPDFAATLLADHAHVVGGIDWPHSLCGLELRSVIDNEKSSPGLGTTLKYGAPFIKADVFVFSAGQNDIPDGIDSQVAQRYFEQAIGDVLRCYTDAGVVVHPQTLVVDGMPLLHCAFQYTEAHPGVRELSDSHLYLTAKNGNLIKVRITYSQDKGAPESFRKQVGFIEALCAALRASERDENGLDISRRFH